MQMRWILFSKEAWWGAIRLPSNGTLKTKEKESGNLIVRAMPFILNFHTQMSSSQLEEGKIFFTRV